jgi:uncharacterized protein (TIGR02246 family)
MDSMTDRMAAEFEIRQLHARYADAVWRKDPDSFADLFAADAVWKIAGTQLEGRNRIRSGFAGFMTHIELTIMVFGTPIVAISDGQVTSRTRVTENNKFADGRTASTIGVYYERFTTEGGSWRFKWRHWNLYYIGPPDFSAPIYPCREYGPPPGMPGADDPTTVRKHFLFTSGDGKPSAGP